MNPLVYHFISGQVFGTGCLLLLASAVCSLSWPEWASRIGLRLLAIGVLLIVLSSTPLPYWIAGVGVIVITLWMIALWKRHWLKSTSVMLILITSIAALTELPYHLPPRLSPLQERHLTILGDSLTAGLGGDTTVPTWPQILADEHQFEIQDFSHIGETTASAWERIQGKIITAPLVIVAIGGNDLLGSTTAAEFRTNLQKLLEELQAPGRQVVLFELPLPPFCQEYGRVQRTLAARYHVPLIPKAVLLSVIARSDATLDSIHLTAAGHEQMAQEVLKLLSP